ncbi:hypothetical protein J1N35_003402 [Gossypium stocksii]|uniref:Uncharacterized protein n=1 Tax=Gossypium stocksii TaxID=47602 RepID=A0A9D3WN44_9ROSI|nr:hypothetical protein J1N35_003402 [Gossypium stocksii]
MHPNTGIGIPQNKEVRQALSDVSINVLYNEEDDDLDREIDNYTSPKSMPCMIVESVDTLASRFDWYNFLQEMDREDALSIKSQNVGGGVDTAAMSIKTTLTPTLTTTLMPLCPYYAYFNYAYFSITVPYALTTLATDTPPSTMLISLSLSLVTVFASNQLGGATNDTASTEAFSVV